MVEQSPYYKATSNDVDWLMKVKMQGRIQKWVDHSISVTINLPNDVDEDLVNRLYVEAWKSGCKGCTVYRDGSRSGVLISAKSDKKEEMPPCKPPTVVETRPSVLDADIVRFQNNKEKWVAFVGLLDGHPYEIFTGLQDDDEGIILPKNVTSGHIIKKVDKDGSKRYDFQFQNKRGYKVTIEGLSEKFNKEYWNYAKLISGVLRYRMPIEQVIKLVGSLQLDSESINTWKNGVERALNVRTAATKHLYIRKVASFVPLAELHVADKNRSAKCKHKRLHRNLKNLDSGSCLIMRNNVYTCIVNAAITKSNII